MSLLGMLIIPWLTIFQWLHHLDEGFIITNAYYFFTHPESINYGFGHYLTDLIGWGMNQLFWWLGLISFRIGYVLILYGTFAWIFLLLRDSLSKNLIFLGLFVAYCFTNNVDAINWVNYYPVTTLFYVWSGYFLYTWLLKSKLLLLWISWLILGVGVFARLPNIVSISIIWLIPLYHIIGKERKILLKDILTIGRGIFVYWVWFMVGIGVMLFFIRNVWHEHLFSEAIQILFGMAKESGETKNHGIGYLISIYIKSLLFVCSISGVTSLWLYISFKISGIHKSAYTSLCVIIWVILGSISIMKFYFLYIIFGLNIFVSYISFLYPFLSCYLFLVLMRSNIKNFTKITFPFLLWLFFMFFIPLGWGGYLEMMQNASFILFPIILYVLKEDFPNVSSFKAKYLPKGLFIIISIASIVCTLHILWINNSPLSYVSHWKLKFISISEDIAYELESIESSIIHKNNSQEWLFLSNFWYASYLYYLYDIVPYLGNSVPAYYPQGTYIEKLTQKIKTRELPLIVIDKFQNIALDNPYRKVGEKLEEITFEILKNNHIMFTKVLETENFIFYTTQTNEKIY